MPNITPTKLPVVVQSIQVTACRMCPNVLPGQLMCGKEFKTVPQEPGVFPDWCPILEASTEHSHGGC